MGKTWSELIVGDDGLLREREVIAQREPKAPSPAPSPPARRATVRVTARGLLSFALLAVCCGVLGGAIVAGVLQQQAAGRAALVERIERAEATASRALDAASAPMTAYERCEDDLRTAWVLFQGDIDDVDPPSCTPPRVTREEYVRAFEAVGGDAVWVAATDGQAAP